LFFSKKSVMLLYDFMTYFFPLGEVQASFLSLLTKANNYGKKISDYF